jgi:cellulose synthase (UDP-forming)
MASADKGRLLRAHVFSTLCFLSGVAYLLWLTQHLNPFQPVMSGLFYAAEVVCFALFAVAAFDVWRLRFKPPTPIEAPNVLTHSVDVFIPTCGEPIEVVRATMAAAKVIHWSGPLTHYVLDDKGDPEVRDLAHTLGFVYLSRPVEGVPNENAKAGNLNFGLSRSSGDFVLVLDADQVPEPDIVSVLASYMKFDDVAFVQSRQHFILPEGDPFFNEDTVFYGTVQSGFDEANTVISCGSGVLYRREALEDIDGFATWNLVEDLTTSYTLHAAGWKSFYVPHSMAVGLAPDTVQGYYRQRGQWALDTMRLMWWRSPLFKRGLTWEQRLVYLTIGVSYLTAGFVVPFFFCIPIWTYLTGDFVLSGDIRTFAALRVLYFVFMALAMQSLFEGRQPARQFRSLSGMFPIYAVNTFKALFYPPGRKPGYTSNNAATGARINWPAWVLLAPQIVLVLANAVLPYYAVLAGTSPVKYVFVNCFISALCIWSLWPVLETGFLPKRYPDSLNMKVVYGVES